MLNLNDDSIKADGSGGNFDPSKIFGYSVVQDNTIINTLDNVFISGFEIGQGTGSKFFDIKLKDSNGNETNMREYEPDPNRDDFEKKKKSQITRLKHILTKFAPEGTQLPQANTFPDLWEAVKTMLIAQQCNTKPMRLKLIYNTKGYLTIPKYVPFIESMSVPAEETKLKLTDFDQLTRPQADKPEAAMAAEPVGDDLPF